MFSLSDNKGKVGFISEKSMFRSMQNRCTISRKFEMNGSKVMDNYRSS